MSANTLCLDTKTAEAMAKLATAISPDAVESVIARTPDYGTSVGPTFRQP